MKTYFTEKIQMTVANSKVLELLLENSKLQKKQVQEEVSETSQEHENKEVKLQNLDRKDTLEELNDRVAKRRDDNKKKRRTSKQSIAKARLQY